MKLQIIIKHIFDLLFSLLGLIMFSPIMLLIALLIKIDSDGPILFKQERIGKCGKSFQIYKFRTMVNNAETLGDGIRVKNNDDSRITKVGNLLRRSSLDELPQLINVLKGEMSLVGPRPPVIYHPYNGYYNYPKDKRRRFSMKPGITGLAQVKFRNSVSWDQRIKYDIHYVNNYSLFLDFKIIFMTVVKVIKPDSLYLEE